jgi:hypothetical protein
MGPYSLFARRSSVSFICLFFFFTLNKNLTDSHTGSAPEARKGIGSPAAGAGCVNKALGRHSWSLECLFRGIGDRATRSEVKCYSYTSWILQVKKTLIPVRSSNFDSQRGYVIRFSLAIGAEDRMSPYLMYLLNRANRGITATFLSCLIP